MQTNFKINDRF